jgi:predicted DNA-binding transcriptional regulator AlpA
MTHDDDVLICTAEVALLLGVEPRTLAAWRQRAIGPVPVRLTSRTLRYRRSDVLAWVERRGGGADAETPG